MACNHPSERLSTLKSSYGCAIFCGKCTSYVRPEELIVHIELADPYSMSIEIEEQSPFIDADCCSDLNLSCIMTAFEAGESLQRRDSWQPEETYFGDI